jgi:hypothetical protein
VRRFPLALWLVAVAVSGCAVGVPQPPTSPSIEGTSIVLNAKVTSSLDGSTSYWFRYGERGDQANWSDTPHETIELTEGLAEPVSARLTGLEHYHRYGWQACWRTGERTRRVSSAPRSESSAPSATSC